MRICSVLSNNGDNIDEIAVKRAAAYLIERETMDCFYIKQGCPLGKLFAPIVKETAKFFNKTVKLVYITVSETEPLPEIMDDAIVVPHKNFYPRETLLPIIEYMIDSAHDVLYHQTNMDIYSICEYTKTKKRKLIMFEYFNFYINSESEQAV